MSNLGQLQNTTAQTAVQPEAESYILSKVPLVGTITPGTASYGNIQPAPGVYDYESSVVVVTYTLTFNCAVANRNLAAFTGPISGVIGTRTDCCPSAQGGTTLVTLGGKQRGQYQKQCATQLNWFRFKHSQCGDGASIGPKQLWYNGPALFTIPAINAAANANFTVQFSVPYRFSHFYPFLCEGKLLSVSDSFNIQQYLNVQTNNIYMYATQVTSNVAGTISPYQTVSGQMASAQAYTNLANIVSGTGLAAAARAGDLTITAGTITSVGFQVYMRKAVNMPIYHEPVISVYEEQPYIGQTAFPCNFSVPMGQGSLYQTISICNTQSTDAATFDVPQTAMSNIQIMKDGVNIVQASELSDAVVQMQMSDNFSGDVGPSLIQCYKQKYSGVLLQHQINLSSALYDTFMGIQKFVPNV